MNEEGPHRFIAAHDDAISYCTFLDDSTIITSSHDKTLKLWKIHSDQLQMLNELHEHSNRVVACSVNNESKSVLSGSWDRTILYWDLDTSKSLWRGNHDTLVTSCDVSPILNLAVSGCSSGSCVFWDTRNGNNLLKTNGHTDTVTCCKFSLNGFNMCSTSMDNTTCIWDVRTNKCLIKLCDHRSSVSSCAFSNNNLYLATTSWDKAIHIYDISAGSYRLTGPMMLQYHEGCVNYSTFSHDDSLLVSCGCDRNIYVWDMSNRRLKYRYKGHTSWIYCSQISKCKKWIVSGSKTCFECGLALINEINPNQEQSIQCVFCRLKRRENIPN